MPRSGTQASLQPNPPDKGGIQVISRAAAILRILQRHPEGLSLGEIGKLVGLPRSTVQRIVDALDQENLLIASSPTMGVRLGPALLSLAAATRFDIADVARGTLEALAKETGETVDLSLLDQDKAVFIDQIASSHRLVAVSAVGASFPLHSAANGKSMLALLSPQELARLKKRISLGRHTPNTLTTWDALERELAGIRATGIAFDREENSEGICAVAMAFRCRGDEIAALSIPVPTQRFAVREQELIAALPRHCSTLIAKL
ncbi:Transcriptional regulator, IclR family [Castellaniella defragrans 65Phen]|uniref:Transcriptional regulator, IclR family n=1 Tax=Castellaniella defragrans (strain DSM 12143 / CCUG 39792 / 65Phen) TaxID=1437824 RepID=W8X007_CASD6|nr:IclR family transcriptional regulator [Castellaniella defragrans]CDM25174.1 Transcriptional regulator, IclR family [Castellaniella defragrans 65Phen]